MKLPTLFLRLRLAAVITGIVFSTFAPPALLAGTATWKLNPATGDWNTAANWTPRTVPNGPSDIATFSKTNLPSISLSSSVEVNETNFTTPASAFTITVPASTVLTLSGIGVVNSSGISQRFTVSGDETGAVGGVNFVNGANAGTLVSYELEGGRADGIIGSYLQFFNSSDAGSATFLIDGPTGNGTSGGSVFLGDDASADHASFTVSGTALDHGGGSGLSFAGNSSAAFATIVSDGASGSDPLGGGSVLFEESATAGHSVITINGGLVSSAGGGTLYLIDNASADQATIVNNGSRADGAGTGETVFTASSTAGQATVSNTSSQASGSVAGGYTWFFGTSSAGSATFTNAGGAFSEAIGGETDFFENSTANLATLTADGGSVPGARAADISFYDNSNAAAAILTAHAATVADAAEGGLVAFAGSSSAAAATITAEDGSSIGAPGGLVLFEEDSTGDTAQLKLFGNGTFDLSFHNPAIMTFGSIEGSGVAKLGGIYLQIGLNNLSTTFSGSLRDGGVLGGSGAILDKLGNGTLTLSGANTYTGGTAIDDGTLMVTSKAGSATGTGSVSVNQGTLGGTSTLSGLISVGVGASGAFIAPGVNGIGALATKKAIHFSASTYLCEVDTKRKRSDSISARGVTIQPSSTLSLIPIGTRALPVGTVFTVLKNTSAAAFIGSFSNLPDHTTITAGSNSFQANYEGGDGNDLTLTVVL